jgi:hypothetical protein
MRCTRNKLVQFIDQLSKRRSIRISALIISLVVFASALVVYSYVSLTSSVIIGIRGSVKVLYFGVYWVMNVITQFLILTGE